MVVKKATKKSAAPAAKKTVKKPRAKVTGKKSAPAKTAKKTVSAKAKAQTTKRATEGVSFTPGTDMALVFEELQRGGTTRTDVNRRIMARFGDEKTKNGNDKPVSTIVNQVLRRAFASGYRIEATWKLVPGDGVATETTSSTQDTPKKVAKKAAKAGVAKKAAKRIVRRSNAS